MKTLTADAVALARLVKFFGRKVARLWTRGRRWYDFDPVSGAIIYDERGRGAWPMNELTAVRKFFEQERGGSSWRIAGFKTPPIHRRGFIPLERIMDFHSVEGHYVLDWDHGTLRLWPDRVDYILLFDLSDF